MGIGIKMPDKVKKIIATIQAAGGEAFAVGGCVRDSILGREPEDWDITTSLSPYRVKELFRRTVDTGLKHGTVTVRLGNEGFEVTTYRIDGAYEDSRHPTEVTFTAELVEDLKRRDFTVNAMAYNEQAGLVDIFDGLGDIHRGVIRCVGEPEERFAEDALRLMRAVRFSAQLGYTIEAKTRTAMSCKAADLQFISAERIQTELVKLITSPHPEYLRVAYETGITGQILPEFDACMATGQNHPHHCYSVGEHLLASMRFVPPEKVLRLTMLLHDIAKPLTGTVGADGLDHFHGHGAKSEELAREICRRLKFDNDTIARVTRLVRFHDLEIAPEAGAVRRAAANIGEELFPLFLQVQGADIAAQSDFRRQEKTERLEVLTKLYTEILAARDCLSLKDLAVTGKDLIAVGIPPGKKMGEMLKELLADVIDHPEHNQKEYLLTAVLLLYRST